MDERAAIGSICRTIWREIESAVDSSMRGVRDGMGREAQNPFTGKVVRLQVPEGSLRLREVLQRRGVAIDAELAALLAEFVREAATKSHFGVLVAFDDESDFEGGPKFKITTSEGDQVPSYLHEVFFEFKPANAAGDE